MKAIYKRYQLCTIVGDDEYGVTLEPHEDMEGIEPQQFYVRYDDNNLIIDPTDDEVALTKE